MQENAELSARQITAASLLAQGLAGREVASKLDVHEDTVCRWRRDPRFRSALADFVEEARRMALESLHGLHLVAVERLGELLRSNNQLVALRAVTEVLDRVREPLPRPPAPQYDDQGDMVRFMRAVTGEIEVKNAAALERKLGNEVT